MATVVVEYCPVSFTKREGIIPVRGLSTGSEKITSGATSTSGSVESGGSGIAIVYADANVWVTFSAGASTPATVGGVGMAFIPANVQVAVGELSSGLRCTVIDDA